MPEGTLIATVVGGAISLASTVVATFSIEAFKQRREARNLAHAFRGGVFAILTIVEERRYQQHFQTLIAAIKTGQDIRPPKIKASRDYVILYTKNVEKIGMLDPALSHRIPMFYTCVNSLLEDIDNMASGVFDEASSQQLQELYEEFLGLLNKTMNLGRHIVAIVEEKYPMAGIWMNLPG